MKSRSPGSGPPVSMLSSFSSLNRTTTRRSCGSAPWERIGEQRRAEDVAHLGSRQAGPDRRRLLAGDDVALDDLHLVGSEKADDAAVRRQRLAAGKGAERG